MTTKTSTRSNKSDPDHLDRLIDEKEAAKFLGYSVRTLQNWRVRGGGPKFVKSSKRSIRYRRCDLIEWAEDRLQSQTSEKGFWETIWEDD